MELRPGDIANLFLMPLEHLKASFLFPFTPLPRPPLHSLPSGPRLRHLRLKLLNLPPQGPLPAPLLIGGLCGSSGE